MAKTRGKRKRGLSEVDKFFIDNHLDLSVVELAKTLNNSESSIEEYLASRPKPKVKKAFHKEKGHAIMTLEDSEAGDKLTAGQPSSIMAYAKAHPEHIHIINPD